MLSEDINPAIFEAIRGAESITVLTGSGISAESGVPTFRDAQKGLWARYDPHDLATPQAYQRNPKLVWDWYEWRRKLIAQASPNAGHEALARLENLSASFSLITQNVDNLHQLAGNKKVMELHGNIFRTKCYASSHFVESWPTDAISPPSCPRCGSSLRPDVVWFGESLPMEAFAKATQAAKACDIFFSIGTSSIVQPAASLPYIALESGSLLVEINTDQTPLSPVADYQIQGPAGVILPILIKNAFN